MAQQQRLNQAFIKTRLCVWFSVLCLCAIVTCCFACFIGTTLLMPSEIFSGFAGLLKGSPTLASWILVMRAERISAAFMTGATLSLAGCLMQALLKNPLSDPYILGVSGGASVGAMGLLFVGGAWAAVQLGAFAGALIVTFLLYIFCMRAFTTHAQMTTLLLTGVMIAFGCGAIVTLFLTIAPDAALRGMIFWLVGDLSHAHFEPLAWCILIGAVILSWRLSPAINLLGLNADMAMALGVRVDFLKKCLFFVAALLSVCAVTTAGCIGFVGLVIPHATRLLTGHDHRILVPCAPLLGGIFLVACDTLARCVIYPMQLPVGVVTALIGVPCFLVLLYRRHAS